MLESTSCCSLSGEMLAGLLAIIQLATLLRMRVFSNCAIRDRSIKNNTKKH